jgi:hypothetical protein
LVHVLFTFYIQDVLKFKNKFGSLRAVYKQFDLTRASGSKGAGISKGCQ